MINTPNDRKHQSEFECGLLCDFASANDNEESASFQFCAMTLCGGVIETAGQSPSLLCWHRMTADKCATVHPRGYAPQLSWMLRIEHSMKWPCPTDFSRSVCTNNAEDVTCCTSRARVYQTKSCLPALQKLLKVSAKQLPKVLVGFWKIQDGPVRSRKTC